MTDHPSKALASFAATLRLGHIPEPVLRRAEDLFLNWFGSALAGKGARPVETMERFAREMSSNSGASEVLISRRQTSPLFAAMVNAAASHFADNNCV
jgi:2-methylcitrate dehydratase PrpD